MKKKIFIGALLAATISLTTLSGCIIGGKLWGNSDDPKSIVSIDKTDSVGLVDYYTITYSDGTTSGFTVTNGKDGQNASEITVDDVYEYYKQTNPDITKEEFIEKFLTIEGGASQNNLNALSSVFRSGLKIYSIFKESTYNMLQGNYVNTDAHTAGSAVIYKIGEDYSYILTNYHMVYNEKDVSATKTCYKVYAYMYGSEYAPAVDDAGNIVVKDNYALECEYIGGSVECDVALLRVPTAELKAKYPYAKAVDINTDYEVGQTVYAIGNPGGQGLSLTKGIVSVDIENVALDIGGVRYYHLLRTDADLDHGSSGGGLFNENGQFIALCNAGSDEIKSINNAIPASTVLSCAESLMYYHTVDKTLLGAYRMRLGVTVSEYNSRYVYDEQSKMGKIVADITIIEPEAGEQNPIEGLAAHTMGLQAKDVIRAITINGTEYAINRMYEMNNVLMRIREGDSVTIIYERDGKQRQSQSFAVTKSSLTLI